MLDKRCFRSIFIVFAILNVSGCGGSGNSSSSGNSSTSGSSSSSGGTPSNTLLGNPDATVSTIITSLNGPDAVTLINIGSVYISEYGTGQGDSIHEYSVSGNLFSSIDGLNGPLGTAINSNGTLYFTNDKAATEGYVFKYDEGDAPELVATIPGWPTGLAADGDDNIYVANFDQNNLYRISSSGELSLLSEDSRLAGSVGIVFAQNSLWMANYNNGRILQVQLDGAITEIVAANAQTNMGIGYITFYNDKLYATDINRHLILEIELDGNITVLAGTTRTGQNDGGGDVASFNMPNGITVDPNLGLLYISEYNGGLRSVQIPAE